MTSNEIALPSRPPVATASRVGQATTIEQSRAVAEVYAAVMIAQQAPRNIQAAIRAMELACKTPELANKAFYEVPRGDKTATDVSIHLARELANAWGNIQSHVAELSLDEQHGQSEMQAVAWDLQANNRVAVTFIQPHRRAGKNAARLVDTQSIYETNANAGARRLRQCILSVLPTWYVERAKALCQKTLNDGGGKPLPERVADALRLFEEEFGVAEADIARTLGKTTDRWTPVDLGKLTITYQSLKQGTIRADEAFPPQKITGKDINAARPATEPATVDSTPSARTEPIDDPPANEEPVENPMESRAPAELLNKVKHGLYEIGITKPREQIDVLGQIAQRKFVRLADVTTDACARANDMLVAARQAPKEDWLNAFEVQLHELSEQDSGT